MAAVMSKARKWGGDLYQSIRPSFLSKEPHFNFITMHYFWIIGFSLLGSILIYASGKGDLAYIDSLYFASGANTQAGLNPVDVNLLNTFQQVVIFLMAMTSNPITLNSVVVFLRLYWFEKRFQGIVEDARSKRITVAKSRSKSKPTPSDIERGVNGRHITVMHDTATASRMTNDGILLEEWPMNGALKLEPVTTREPPAETEVPASPRDTQIRFADKVKRSDAIPAVNEEDDEDDVPLPRRRSNTEHIAILERQRKQDAGGVLRIPGPRDAERGIRPEELSEEEDNFLDAPATGLRRRRDSSLDSHPQQRQLQAPTPSHPDRPRIVFEEPEHPKRQENSEDADAASHTPGLFKFHRSRGQGEKLHQTDTESRVNPLQRIRTALSQHQEQNPAPYLSWQPTLGRNSEFLDLTEEQREELGGIEYRSLKTLAYVLFVYFWGFWIFGLICIWPWIAVNNDFYGNIVEQAGVSRAWWAIFTSNSAFMDLGFTLTADSMNSFNSAIWLLLVMSFLIIIGNTGFPIMLRFMIWVINLFVPRDSGLYEELRFLLDHPRRCFTLLFPSTATWWLFLILIIMNLVDLIFFIILDLGTGAIAELPLHIRFLEGWFQAASTRTAGFSVVNLSLLHPAVQTSYLIMMYISVFPIAISVRRTNVYEEKALGLYGSSNDEDEKNEHGFSYVGAHLRRQLSFDLWYIFIGYFILTITEGQRLIDNDFSMFAVLFEIVSAYGTVGLSLGYTGVNASLCSQFSTVGKLVMIAMQIRGRHRGLPYGLDRAILLPSEALNQKEADDADARLNRRQSHVSMAQDGAGTNLARGRSRSVDRRNVLAQILHPGPTYPLSHTMSKSQSMAKTERSVGYGTSMMRRATTAELPSEDNDSESQLGSKQPKRAETMPEDHHQ